MKGKDNNTNLTARQTGQDENNNLRRHPLYSAGEDFYSISYEEKGKGTEIIFSIKGIKRKDELSSNGTLATALVIAKIRSAYYPGMCE